MYEQSFIARSGYHQRTINSTSHNDHHSIQMYTPFLCNPEPDFLDDVSWVLYWPVLILSIKRRLARRNIGIVSLNPWTSLEDLPEGIKHEEDWNPDIGSEEV
jgi:hypothetical protein